MAEEADGGAAELELRGLSVQLAVPQRLEYRTHVHQMLLTRLEKMSMMSQYTCTNCPSMGAQEPGGPTAGRARPVESKDKAPRPKIECMKRNDVLCWSSSRMMMRYCI